MTPAEIVVATASLYAQGGRPAPLGHQQFAVQLLMNVEKPERLLRYVEWAFASRLWREPAKTKGLLQLLKDGDWDVDLTPRTIDRKQALRRMTDADTMAELEAAIAAAHPDDREWLRGKMSGV